jgi:hypothetical protein
VHLADGDDMVSAEVAAGRLGDVASTAQLAPLASLLVATLGIKRSLR